MGTAALLEYLVTFSGGMVVGALAYIFRPQRKLTAIIHIRGKTPGVYSHLLCVKCLKAWGLHRNAEFIDQDTRAWCSEHLPMSTRYAERASLEGDGPHCAAHGMDCPKPWSIV